jgi:hypothetical protein
MDQAFALHALAYAYFRQQINGALLQNSGSHALLTVLATARFDND